MSTSAIVDATLARASAYLLSGVVATSYLAAITLSQLISPSKPPEWRNRFQVVRARMTAVSISSLLCCVMVWSIVKDRLDGSASASDFALQLLGLPNKLEVPSITSIKPYFIVPILFLGPLYAQFLSQELPFQKNWTYEGHLKPTYLTFLGLRNHVLAPITEEVTYRACVLSLFKLGGISKSRMIWLAPCWFGVAHLYHAIETFKRFGRNMHALQMALFQTGFQFCYTTIFGWLCSFLFTRTGSLSVCILAHSFCNTMGFPQLRVELQEHPEHKKSLLFAYLLGAGAFIYVLFPWSRTSGSIYWPGNTM